MSGGFVDPVAAMLARGGAAKVDPVTAARAVDIADNVMTLHKSTIRVWIDKARAVVLPTVTSYTFTQDELDAIHEAHEIDIVDKISQQRGWQVRKSIGTSRRAVTTWYEQLRKPFRQVCDAVLDLDGRDAQPLTEAQALLDEKLIAYEKAAKALEEAERRRLQAIEDERAARERAEAAAAMQRVADAERDEQVKAALSREAQAIAQMPVSSVTVSVASQRAKVRGTGISERHCGSIVDEMAFVKAVVDGRIPLDQVECKNTWVDTKAIELKEQLSVVYPFLKYEKKEGTRG